MASSLLKVVSGLTEHPLKMPLSIPLPARFSTPTATVAGSEACAVRAQADVVRSLLDELDRIAPPSDRPSVPPKPDAVESLAHLARRMMAAVASMTPPPPAVACGPSEEE